jgi:hypothetical protein
LLPDHTVETKEVCLAFFFFFLTLVNQSFLPFFFFFRNGSLIPKVSI